MLRFFSFLALAMVAVCLAIGASIALADDHVPAEGERAIEAINPDRRVVDESLVSAEDIYEFDFVVTHSDVANPEFTDFSMPTDTVEI